MQPHVLGIVSGIGCAFTWAIGGILSKVVIEGKDPTFINAIQSVFSSVLMILVVIAMRMGGQILDIEFPTFLILAMAALLGLVLGNTFFITSLKSIPVSVAFPLASSYPVFTVIFAWLLIREAITGFVVLAAALVVGGIGLLGKSQDPDSETTSILSTARGQKGSAIALFSAIVWGVGTVVMKIGTLLEDTIIVSTFMAWIAAICLLTWQILRRNLQEEYKKYSPSSWVILGIAGIVGGTGLTNILFLLSVHYVGASRAAILTATSPLFSALLAWIFLRERLSLISVIGILFIISGTVIVSM